MAVEIARMNHRVACLEPLAGRVLRCFFEGPSVYERFDTHKRTHDASI